MGASSERIYYPKVLICSINRVNRNDTFNNNLLLRNLFAEWPRENLAQIYSSGDNGDDGFCGCDYQLGSCDRVLGSLFYRLKGRAKVEIASVAATDRNPVKSHGIADILKKFVNKMFIDSGLYELLFRPRLSAEMNLWVKEFQPEIIFAQGYNLTFTWLPVMLARHFHLPLAYYPTDDWPKDLYANPRITPQFVIKVVRRFVTSSVNDLVNASAVRITFNSYMQETYQQRYGRDFSQLMHGDSLGRYAAAEPQRLTVVDECSIVCTGVFDQHRLPLLYDLDQACEILALRGTKVRVTVLTVNFPMAGDNTFKHLHIAPCPAHNELPSILRGADILFLPERFDETSKDICLCISSKAHLFMYAGQPIIVYSDPVTGIARYAREEGWAEVVDRRDPELLAATIDRLMKDPAFSSRLAALALQAAQKNHNLEAIQAKFLDMINIAVQSKRG